MGVLAHSTPSHQFLALARDVYHKGSDSHDEHKDSEYDHDCVSGHVYLLRYDGGSCVPAFRTNSPLQLLTSIQQLLKSVE